MLAQQPPPKQVLLVIDHNEALVARARREWPWLTVLENVDEPGLSGSRNSGLREAACDVTVFLDDDAVARPGWLSGLVEPYSDPKVVATGGHVFPVWPAARPPRWLPPEFYWIVGCSYRGLPETAGPVRNPIGASMSMRTAQTLAVGGFYSVIGRVGLKPRGCEETELSIRLAASQPGSVILYLPESGVDHTVSRERVRFGYFVRRNWHEGQSKAMVVKLAGARAGLERERRHVAAVLPRAVLNDLRRAVKGEPRAALRAGATVVGIAVVAAGYVSGATGLALSKTRGRG